MPLPLLLGAGFAGFFSVLARFLVPFIIVKVLLGLAITTFSITGTLFLVDYLESAATTHFNNLGIGIGQVMILAGTLDGLGIVFNSWIVAIQIRTVKGAFKGFKLGGS